MISKLNDTRWMKLFFVGCLLLGLLTGNFSLARALDPSPIVVNTSEDTIIDDGSCSLRDAVTAAANKADFSGCTYLGQDVISLAANTYAVNSAININTTLTIQGASAATTILMAAACNPAAGSCVHTHGFFNVQAAGNLDMSNLTLKYAANSAVINSGILKITFSSLINNKASQGAAVKNLGSMTLENSTLNGNTAGSGGAIFNAGSTLTIRSSTFTNNTATAEGGAIASSAPLVIETSSFSGNTAGTDGGAIVSNATLTLQNSTLANNSAGNIGGGLLSTDILNLLHATLYKNSATNGGGGLRYNGNTSIINSIITQSTNGDCSVGTQGTFESISNLITDGSCSASLAGDAFLGILQDNGGTTLTILPNRSPDTSLAIDNANLEHCLATDQRGYVRPRGNGCDIGAVEVGLPINVTTTANENNVDNADCSLQEALQTAINNTSGYGCTYLGANIVTVPAGVYTTGYLNITKPVFIEGHSAADTILQSTDCNPAYPVSNNTCLTSSTVINIEPGIALSLKRLTIRYASPAIYNSGSLTLQDSIIRDNSLYSGAGINNAFGGTAFISGSTFVGNLATDPSFAMGAGILNYGTLTLENSTVSGNQAYSGAGLFNSSDSVATVSNSTFSGNVANFGGGLYNLGILDLTNTIIANSAGSDCSTLYGTLRTNSSNLVEDGSCAPTISGDPGLGPLQDNGGPTPTHAFSIDPLSGVFDAGGDTCPAADQRGLPRPQFGACDIGAYELQFSPTVLQSPANATLSNNTTPTLSWAAAFGASQYKVHYFRYDLGALFEFVSSAQAGTSLQANFATEGDWLWRVESLNASDISLGTSDVWTYSVDLTPPAVPGLSSPANAFLTRDNTPTVSLLTTTGASKYMAQFANNAAFTSPLTSAELTGLNFTPATRADGTWYWRVRARDALGNWSAYSSARSLVIDTVAPAAPVLGSPLNAGFTNDTTPTFTWLASIGASKYQLQYASNALFTGAFTSPELAALSFTQATALTQGLRYWHVRAMDAAGNWSVYSAARSFTIDTIAPLAPLLLAPANGARTSDHTPTFTWKASTGAASYQLCYSGSSTFATSTCVLKKGVLTHTPPTNLAAKTWYWRVRAQDAAGNWSPWSLKRSLIVQ